MHKFLRAVGFSKINRDEIKDLVLQSVKKNDSRGYTMSLDDVMLAEFSRDVGENIGITAAGTFSEDDLFHTDYYFPYLKGTGITSMEDVSVERHAARDSYAGICDDVKVGITIIFYLQNITEYLNVKYIGHAFKGDMNVTLSALSIDGKIILPVNKTPVQVNNHKEYTKQRSSLIAAAREGDEDAIENLTLEDMDMYAMLSRRVVTEDVLSIVDTSFMPYGIESDQYAIIAQILDFRLENNKVTQNEVYILTVDCNDLIFDVCIAKDNLLGEPAVGRRFKGSIWMQGRINYDYSI